MRRPRDYDAELKALDEKARGLKERRIRQLGELVIATGADALPIELLAGALLATANEKNLAVREGWRVAGARFFQGTPRIAPNSTRERDFGAPDTSGKLPFGGEEGAQ